MKTRVVVVRGVSVAACLLTLAAACSSSSHGTSTATTATSQGPSTTADALHTPNSIPFVVGAKVGLPNGWLVEVAKVHRPYASPVLGVPTQAQLRMAMNGPLIGTQRSIFQIDPPTVAPGD